LHGGAVEGNGRFVVRVAAILKLSLIIKKERNFIFPNAEKSVLDAPILSNTTGFINPYSTVLKAQIGKKSKIQDSRFKMQVNPFVQLRAGSES